MEAATAADLTQASEIAVRYITLGIAAKGYVSDMTVDSTDGSVAIAALVYIRRKLCLESVRCKV